MHHDAVGDLGQGLDDGVELRRSQADAATVEGGVTAAGDDARAAVGDRDPVAVTPHARVVLEVRGAVARAVLVAPEPDRHRRHGLLDDELAELPAHRGPRLVEGVDVGAQRPTGDLTGVHGDRGCARDEGRAGVGASRDGAQLDRRIELVVDPPEAGLRKGRPRGADRAQRGQVGLPGRMQSLLAALEQERRARAEVGDAELAGEPPQHGEVGVGGVAVDHDDRRADADPGHQVVPHHPAGGGEPEEAVGGAEVALQAQGLEVLDRDAAVPVDDRLGQAGRAGGEQHVERRRELESLELQRPGPGGELRPPDGALGRTGGRVEVGQPDHGAHAGQGGVDLADLLAPVDALVAVPVAVDGQ